MSKVTPLVMNRGKYGFAVLWPAQDGRKNSFDSAMPDEATARQCAAAADLLAALERLLADTGGDYCADTDHIHTEVTCARCNARAAIAKARPEVQHAV